MTLTERFIRFHEGVRSRRYFDGLGIPTIGVGHNLAAARPCQAVIQIQRAAGKPDDDDWSPESIQAQLNFDIRANCDWLWHEAWWVALDEARQAALNDFAFNLGPQRARAFTTFLGLCAVSNFADAADDLLKTAVARQLPKRYGELAQVIRDGTVGPWLPMEV